jgi:6-phosphogluconate dehydrogenase
MKITNIDTFIEEFRNGRDIWSKASIELVVREISRLREENENLKRRLAASKNDVVLLEVSGMLKKTQERVQELEVHLKKKDIVISNQQARLKDYAKRLLDLGKNKDQE